MWTKQQIWQVLLILSIIIVGFLSVFLSYKEGLIVLFATVPIIIVLVFANQMVNKTLKSSRNQADQAARHVKELSHYIAEQEKTAVILQKSEERFRNAFDYAAVGMALVQSSGRILKVNRKLCDILGYQENELLNIDYENLIYQEDLESLNLNLSKLLSDDLGSFEMEKRVYHKSGEILWLNWSSSFLHDDLNQSSHFIFQLQDITDRKRAEERLAHDALHDALTGLPNRTLFLDRLQVSFARASRNFKTKFAVLYLDFDRFKLVNDNFGHLIGDKLLIEISHRLKSIMRESDTIARLGGDEFTMLVEEISSSDEAVQVAERIRKEMAKPFDLNGQDFFATISIGIANWSRDYDQPEFLLRDADTALYQAKRSGRDGYKVFDKEMHQRALRLLQIETDLRYAIERNEFFLVYQPIVDLIDQKLCGFEALLRWQHPIHGLVPPLEFISIAEETGQILQIGEWVLREACTQLNNWRSKSETSKDLWMSVNVSTKQFTQTDLVSLVAGILEETNLDPNCLKLEVTESAMVENIDFAVDVMSSLKKLGLKLSIDDFGTGYSSLSYLHRLPLSSLKIDRSFVNQMSESVENQEIIKTIVSLAQSLRLEIIAEGVENSSQMKQLKELDCEFGQGYYFAKPLEAKKAESLVDELSKSSTRDSADDSLAA